MVRLLLASMVPLLVAGCHEGCTTTGRNEVRAAVDGTANIGGSIMRVGGQRSDGATPSCRSVVSGWIQDTGGTASIQLNCSDPRWADRAVMIDLPDPRTLTGTSSTRLTLFRSAVAGVGDGEIVSANVEVIEATGASAPMPRAVTDDFVRHLRITASVEETQIALDVALTAEDLRQPLMACEG